MECINEDEVNSSLIIITSMLMIFLSRKQIEFMSLKYPLDGQEINACLVCRVSGVGGATRPLPRDGGVEELHGDPTVGPRPKVWTRGQNGRIGCLVFVRHGQSQCCKRFATVSTFTQVAVLPWRYVAETALLSLHSLVQYVVHNERVKFDLVWKSNPPAITTT